MTTARAFRLVEPERNVALVVRVSTDGQARNPEGSLTTQLQRLRQHLALKGNAAGAVWTEVAVYELRGVSGKNSVRSPEMAGLFDDIAAGRVNTVLFASLSRFCRSVRDFLQFVEFLELHGASFISLKEDYDTTSAHGRLIITILMALAEFEREQTSERTKDAFQARSERGLWNGGQLLGYDLDAANKGYLIPNEDESTAVNFAFETYLALGSITETVNALNAAGFRTKPFTSRREVVHTGGIFATTTVQRLLKNPAYIGKKEVRSGHACTLVDAVWPGVVPPETFEAVQDLMARNGRTHRSVGKEVRHAHVLSRGLLFCGRCDTPMTGRSGTGKGGKTYFYYACPNKDCALRVVADEVEGAVLDRIALLADLPDTVQSLVSALNTKRARQLPALEKRHRAQQRELAAITGQAKGLLAAKDGPVEPGGVFLRDQMLALEGRRAELESGIAATVAAISAIKQAGTGPDAVRDGLRNFRRAYEHLRPYEKHDLLTALLHRAVVGDRELTLELYEEACAGFAQASKSDSRFGTFDWLPGRDSNPEHFG